MATSRLQRVIADYRKRLLQHEAQAESTLNAAHSHTLQTINAILDVLYHEIQQKVQKGEEIPVQWLYENSRLKILKARVSNQIDHFGTLALSKAGELQHVGVQLGMQSAQDLLQTTVPSGVSWSFGVPSHKAIENLIGATQKGSPLADLFNGFGEEAADKVGKALITGLTLGWNPRDVAPSVQDALGISRARALVITRNEMLRCYKSANLETFRANSDTVEQWRWSASNSARTCAMCLAMDGTLHDLDQEFESHVQCRCAPVPVTKSWDSILSSVGIDTSDIEETSIAESDAQTGADWFEAQSEATKQQVLGSKAAYDLYASGDVSLQDFVGVAHDPDWGGSRYQKSVKDLVK